MGKGIQREMKRKKASPREAKEGREVLQREIKKREISVSVQKEKGRHCCYKT